MKTTPGNIASAGIASDHQRRRKGTIFHYYMVYLFLSGVLMTSAGLCLHAILKADQVDSRVAIYLKTLTRFDHVLRTDVINHKGFVVQPTTLILRADDSDAVRWSIDRNVVLKESVDKDQPTSSDRFVFPNGTQLAFREDGPLVVCSIQEAATMPAGYEESQSQAKVLEIMIAKPSLTQPKPQATEAADVVEPGDEAKPEAAASPDSDTIDPPAETTDAGGAV